MATKFQNRYPVLISLYNTQTFLMVFAHLYVFLGSNPWNQGVIALTMTATHLAIFRRHGNFSSLGAFFGRFLC